MYNFSAGPGVLPKEVLLEAQKDFIDFKGSGISIIEASHRGKVYEPVHNECIALFRELMNIPDNYDVLLVQGGASTQFEAVPLNLLKKGRADYIVTGNFAKKAYKEAQNTATSGLRRPAKTKTSPISRTLTTRLSEAISITSTAPATTPFTAAA